MNLGSIRVGMLTLAFAGLVLGGVWTAGAGPQPDTDGDGTPDFLDNCLGQANATQTDSNGDGYGNRCDFDYSNTGTVGIADITRVKTDFNLVEGDAGFNPDVDSDDNNTIGISDVTGAKTNFNGPPGPSACVPTACVPQ